MIQCNRCHKQYIGETKRQLNIQSKPTTVSEHFLSNPNHSNSDMQLLLLEIINYLRDSIRKARKAHLLFKANTLEH